jgi:hypothetical protein
LKFSNKYISHTYVLVLLKMYSFKSKYVHPAICTNDLYLEVLPEEVCTSTKIELAMMFLVLRSVTIYAVKSCKNHMLHTIYEIPLSSFI